MSSYPKRGPEDQLLSPQNAMLTVIDYQPVQINSVNSMNRAQLVLNAQMVIKLAKLYQLPILLSTVNANNSRNQDTIPRLRKTIGEDLPSYDRSSINAWEDQQYQEAVKETGRKKLIILGLWTEACLAFPTLDALKEGFDVYPVVDAVGGTSPIAHESALRRIEQAGAHLISVAQLACELQRDWNREETAREFADLMSEFGAFTNFY